MVSLYNYRANRSDELTIRRGDVIQVLYKDNDNWWFGRLVGGQQGYFLASYVVDQSRWIRFPPGSETEKVNKPCMNGLFFRYRRFRRRCDAV